MSGHSKWATTKHHKAAQDAARSKLFAKLAKEISLAARDGVDPHSNTKLKMAIAKAKAKSLPAKNIQKAIDSGDRNKIGTNFQEIKFEAHLKKGVVLIIECLTDNSTRCNANLKAILRKMGGALGPVVFLFNHVGVLEIAKTVSEDEIMETGLDYIENIVEHPDYFEIHSSVENLHNLKESLEKINVEDFKAIELRWIAKEHLRFEDEQQKVFLDQIEKIENDDDVQNVFHNLELEQ